MLPDVRTGEPTRSHEPEEERGGEGASDEAFTAELAGH